jgi:hypothetical protein
VIGDDVILWGCHVFCKPAHEGYETPWHQDGHYWPIRPLANCTVWVALEPSTLDNGCLRVIPRSHRDRVLHAHLHEDRTDLTLNQRMADGTFDEAQAVDIELQPGQISLPTCTIHGARPNFRRGAAPAWRCACRRPRCSSVICARRGQSGWRSTSRSGAVAAPGCRSQRAQRLLRSGTGVASTAANADEGIDEQAPVRRSQCGRCRCFAFAGRRSAVACARWRHSDRRQPLAHPATAIRPGVGPIDGQARSEVRQGIAVRRRDAGPLTAVTIQPTPEYDAKPHKLGGPLLSAMVGPPA